jgi:hypothetical protein
MFILAICHKSGQQTEKWYSLWNTTDGSQFESMMLSYELAFDSNFNWVQGGKLPGLRGGADVNDCSGECP